MVGRFVSESECTLPALVGPEVEDCRAPSASVPDDRIPLENTPAPVVEENDLGERDDWPLASDRRAEEAEVAAAAALSALAPAAAPPRPLGKAFARWAARLLGSGTRDQLAVLRPMTDPVPSDSSFSPKKRWVAGPVSGGLGSGVSGGGANLRDMTGLASSKMPIQIKRDAGMPRDSARFSTVLRVLKAQTSMALPCAVFALRLRTSRNVPSSTDMCPIRPTTRGATW
mmetsp:Transcript_34611/g.78935  ORF Transcript_34611/g.78935 Transcript_34611/m.78935 type:complete len:228 (+) Transcript_34611:1179-1862(+)